MKRHGDLYARVISLDNLRLADQKARRGKLRTYGVRLFDKDREGNLERLHAALRDHTFTTSPYSVSKVYEPKERLIHRLPYYPDRIVHHAIMNVLGPIWTRIFPHNTYSCIKGRGITACMGRVRAVMARHKEAARLYCLKTDIRKFYPSIPHQSMKGVVRRSVKDTELLALLDDIIDSTDGLPIGNYISQPMANLLTAYILHKANEQWHAEAVAYADDIVFFSESKERLHAMATLYKDELARYGLELKANWQVFPVASDRRDRHGRALDFVGYQFFREHTLLRKRIKQRMFREAARIVRGHHRHGGKDVAARMAAWRGWMKHCDARNLERTINDKITS